jgi:hypothetical protein
MILFVQCRHAFVDVKLLERWYLLDDKLSPPAYKLKEPDEDFVNILSHSATTYDISVREHQEWNEVYTSLTDLFVSVLHEKSGLKSKHESSLSHDIPLLSGVEMLFNYAAKLSPSGCMCIFRQFDGMHVSISRISCFDAPFFLPH